LFHFRSYIFLVQLKNPALPTKSPNYHKTLQTFAAKINPTKPNSPLLLFYTDFCEVQSRFTHFRR